MGAQLHLISATSGGQVSAERELDVVFVHGLGGDPFSTWRHGEDESTSWPHWLAEEYGERIAVWSFGYPASKSMIPRWKEFIKKSIGRPYDEDAGYSMPLPDRARNALNVMVRRGIGQRPCVFIVHSLGGLLVKYLLNLSHEEDQASKEHALIGNCKAVMFLATPHQGSDLASLLSRFRLYFKTITIDELKDNDSHLRDLYQRYQQRANDYQIDTRSFFESRATSGAVVVVKPDSANPGVGKKPLPHDADHVTIARPRRDDDEVVLEARELIEAQLRSNPTPLKATVSEGPIPDLFDSSDFHLKVSVEETAANTLQLFGQEPGERASHSCQLRFSLYQGQTVLSAAGILETGFSPDPLCFHSDDPSPLIDAINRLRGYALDDCQGHLNDNPAPLRLHLHLLLPVTWLSGPLPEEIRQGLGRQMFFGCSKRAELADSATIQLRAQAIHFNQTLHSGSALSSLLWATVFDGDFQPVPLAQLFQSTPQAVHLSASDLDREAGQSELAGRHALLAAEHTLLFAERFSGAGEGSAEGSVDQRWLRLVEIGLPLVVWWRGGDTPPLSPSLDRFADVLKGSWSEFCDALQLLARVLNPREQENRAMKALLANIGIFYEEPLRRTQPGSYHHPRRTAP
jgi:hypothetical protein